MEDLRLPPTCLLLTSSLLDHSWCTGPEVFALSSSVHSAGPAKSLWDVARVSKELLHKRTLTNMLLQSATISSTGRCRRPATT